MSRRFRIAAIVTLTLTVLGAGNAYAQSAGVLHDEREVHFGDVRQMTFGGENAEAYWSPDGSELVFQSKRPPFDCDQIFRMPVSDPAALTMVSTGTGRTTCAYYHRRQRAHPLLVDP